MHLQSNIEKMFYCRELAGTSVTVMHFNSQFKYQTQRFTANMHVLLYILVIIKLFPLFPKWILCHESVALPKVAGRDGDLPDTKSANILN
jgi:hypothetical protein